MYSLHRDMNLVTVASNFDENLAISNTNNDSFTDYFAVIHQGYVNVVPLIENKGVVAKYIPIHPSENRGTGVIKQVRWLKLEDRKVFVIASTAGLQVYDKDQKEVLFHHACNETGDCIISLDPDYVDYIKGICSLLNGQFLTIGTHLGNIWMFRYNPEENMFTLHTRLYGHEEPISQLDGYGRRFVTCSEKAVYVWQVQLPVKHGVWNIIRKLQMPGLLAVPTSLKFTEQNIFIGYESGEFCVFDLYNHDFGTIRMVAHRLKVTAIDFAEDAKIILTASMDQYLKIWRFVEKIKPTDEYECLQTICNQDGPICGAKFLNSRATEFFTVTANELIVKSYIKDIEALNSETDFSVDEDSTAEGIEMNTLENNINLEK